MDEINEINEITEITETGKKNIQKIIKMYDNLTYFDQYGATFILFIIITIALICFISYCHVMMNAKPIIDDWPNQRCNPTTLPFAGLITHPEGVTASEYTNQNFQYCTQNILSNITGYAIEPITYVTGLLQTLANSISESIQDIRDMFDKIRGLLQSISQEIMGRILNFLIPLQQIIISVKDMIAKIQGVLTAGLFTALGTYYTLTSILGAVVQFIIYILIAFAVIIACLWILPFTWGVAAVNTSIFIAISIPLAIILVFMVDVLHIKANFNIPKLKCFDKNTLIVMNNGESKKIIDINIGDILSNNNEVTAVIKVTKQGSEMYSLDNIIVSNSHIVKYKNEWIPVSKHPDAYHVKNYDDKFLYCLNTSKKIIEINNHLFTDWDEIYDSKLEIILNNKLTPISSSSDIHKYLEYGFSNLTQIKVKNVNIPVNIHNLKIDDILENGEKIYGIVEINGENMNEQFKYNLGENNFIEGYMPTLPFKKEKLINKHKKLYHILTDQNIFKINNLNNLTIQDYNYAIDRFLK